MEGVGGQSLRLCDGFSLNPCILCPGISHRRTFEGCRPRLRSPAMIVGMEGMQKNFQLPCSWKLEIRVTGASCLRYGPFSLHPLLDAPLLVFLLTMPTLSSLTRSLTLPLNRKRSKPPQTFSTVNSPADERAALDFPTPDSVTTPPPQPRRQNSFLGIKSPNTNGGIFNLNLDGLLNSNAKSFVPPPYVAPDTATPENVVFGKPLKESLKYASVQISTANADGELYVWGYIPVVVAKWCVTGVLGFENRLMTVIDLVGSTSKRMVYTISL